MLETITKRLTARLAVLSIAFAGAVAAAPAHAEFRGGGIIHGFSGCAAIGWADGEADHIRARYGPSEVFGAPSTVSLFFPNGGALHLLTGSAMEPGQSRYRSRGFGVFRTLWFWDGRARMRVNYRQVILPRNASFAEADAIDMGFLISNFGGDPNCSARVDLSLHGRE